MWHVRRTVELHTCLVRKAEGKKPRGRPRRGWESNIKVNLQGTGWGWGRGMDWIGMAADSDECKQGNVHSGSIKCWKFID